MFAFMHLISGYLWNYTYCYCTMCHNLEVLYFYSCGRRFSSAVSDVWHSAICINFSERSFVAAWYCETKYMLMWWNFTQMRFTWGQHCFVNCCNGVETPRYMFLMFFLCYVVTCFIYYSQCRINHNCQLLRVTGWWNFETLQKVLRTP